MTPEIVSKNNQDFDQLIDRLKAKGFYVYEAGGQCPFQITANHEDGWSIYFQARQRTASLEIYNCRQTRVLPDDEHLLWYGGFKSWDEYEAGWITPNIADYALSLLLADGLERLDLPVSKEVTHG